MAGSKFNLPSSLRKDASGTTASEALQIEQLRTERAGIDANAKIQNARLGVAMQVLDVVKKGLEVVEAFYHLQATTAQWQGRIEVAELELKKAATELEVMMGKNVPIREQLEQSRRTQDYMLILFDDLMAQAQEPGVERADKQRLTNNLLQLSQQLVALSS